MTTGKVALDELELLDATMPTESTVPKTLVVEPVGVIWACRPFLIEARSALPTVASTTQDEVEMTTMSSELLEPLEAFDPAEPLPDPPTGA